MMRNLPCSILLPVVLCVTPATAQSLTDPGPVWAGISDTASFRVTVERHLADAERAIAEVKAVRGARTVDNTVVPRKTAEHHLDAAAWLARIALDAHPDAEFRDVAQAWEGRIAERSAAFAVDRELYDALAAVDLAGVDAGTRYIVERDLAAYRRNGVDRDEVTRDRIAALRAQLTDLGTRFERNIFTDVRSLRLHPDALAGVPDDLFAAHSPGEDGLLAIELTPANIGPLLTYAERDSVRSAAFQAMYSAGSPRNVAVVDSLRALRHELAGLLGFSSWAAYAMEPMMAGSPGRVRTFIAEIDEASTDATRREVGALLAVQRSEDPAAEAVDVWSYQHWQHRLRQQAYGFDEQAMREYLPYNRVRDGILATFEQLFGLTFRRAPDTPVWSDAVEPYEVWENGAVVGRIYLDMHPREGKYRHFAAFPLRLGGGTLPEMALVCNFPGGGGAGDPGLLSPGDLRTFFHEFGHLIDFLMAGRAPLVGSFEWDFVEAPSQLLEEWARDTIVLSHFARHYETGEPIPTELVASYRRAEAFGRALFARVSLWLAALSLDLHDDVPAADPTAAIEERVTAAYLPFDRPAWFRPAASVPHISAYSSNYYTYLWSEVIARDLLTAFDPDNLLDPETGRRYRDVVLVPTGTAPSGILVERFLGRPFNADAWRRWLDGETRIPAASRATDAARQPVRDTPVHVAPATGESMTGPASIFAALEQIRPGCSASVAAGPAFRELGGRDTDTTWVDPSPHTVRFIAVSPDVRIEVLDWGGSGETLVFLAGLSNNAHAFDGLAPRFTDRYRVLGITRRGHGASSWPESGYELDTLVGDILTVLDSLGIRQAIFAGHSFGGSELTHLASLHPDRVLGLIYIDAVQDLTHIEAAMQHCAFGAELDAAIQQQFADPEAFRRTQLRTQPDGSFGPNASVQAMPQLIQGAMVRDYSPVQAPALAISYVPERLEEIFLGRDVSEECVTVAQRVTYGGLAAFTAGVQRGTVVALRDGQHNLHLVSPDALETIMRRWLDRIER